MEKKEICRDFPVQKNGGTPMIRIPCTLLVLVFLAAGSELAKDPPHKANPLFQELLSKGVSLGGDKPLVFREPLMTDGMTAADQKKQLKALCVGPDPRKPLFAYEDVIDRDSAAAYFFENRQSKYSDPQAPAHVTDIWFVAYGDLAKLARRDPLQLFGTSPSDAVVTTIDRDALVERKIDLTLKAPLRERYVNTAADLLDTVKLSLTSQVVISQSSKSLVVASKVDPRFTRDREYPNFWQMLPEGLDANPKAPRGPQPIEVGAFYLKITRLVEPKDGLFVEFHQVSTEPKAWFNGAPIVRGKLPLWVDKRVKEFRVMSQKTTPKSQP
jgi:hypothetical protein